MVFLSLVHIITASLSLGIGFVVLVSKKATLKHRRLGAIYFLLMLLTNISSLFIYNSFGKWFFPHTLAVVTLAVLVPGYLVAYFRGFRAWLVVHLICFLLSYYLLIGGAIAEAFLRIPYLRALDRFVLSMSHLVSQVLFLGIIIYFVSRYRKLSVL
jgi:uncharacterized membrane protein